MFTFRPTNKLHFLCIGSTFVHEHVYIIRFIVILWNDVLDFTFSNTMRRKVQDILYNYSFCMRSIHGFYYIMILFKQLYWLSCCHLTFRKIWYCLIKTRIDLVSLSFSNEIYKKNHMNSISIRPMDIKVMWNVVQSESSY